MKQALIKSITTGLQTVSPALGKPISGRIIVTSNCPLRCKMCTFWHNRHQDPGLDLVKHWIREMADFGIKSIAIGGGEPFVRKDLTQIVEQIKSFGIHCNITTSGFLVGKVPFPPVDECVVSIDGADAKTHDAIRGIKGSFDRAVNAVRVAKEKSSIRQINFVLQKDNYHQLVDVGRLAKKLGVRVSIIPVSQKLAAQNPLKENLKEFNMPRLKTLLNQAVAEGNLIYNSAFYKLFLSKIEKGANRQKCMAPYYCLLIYSNGDIYPCGNLDLTAGNLSFDTKLKDLYDGYKALREEIWSGAHPFCGKCIYPDIRNRGILLGSVQRILRRPAP